MVSQLLPNYLLREPITSSLLHTVINKKVDEPNQVLFFLIIDRWWVCFLCFHFIGVHEYVWFKACFLPALIGLSISPHIPVLGIPMWLWTVDTILDQKRPQFSKCNVMILWHCPADVLVKTSVCLIDNVMKYKPVSCNCFQERQSCQDKSK